MTDGVTIFIFIQLVALGAFYVFYTKKLIGWGLLATVLFLSNAIFPLTLSLDALSTNIMMSSLSLMLGLVSMLYVIQQAFELYRKKKK